MVGSIEVSDPFLVQHGWVGLRGYAYFFGFTPISIKSAFEPITPPLKWVLTDGALKISLIFFNIASIRAVGCPMVQKHRFFLEFFSFRDFE